MDNLTISALSVSNRQALVDHVWQQGIDLSAVEQLDFAGLQLLIALYLEGPTEFQSRVRGALAPALIEPLLKAGGALTAADGSEQRDLSALWSLIQ